MLTQDLLNEIFTYDPETGAFDRIGIVHGHKARPTLDEYRQVSINNKTHSVHRIIWLMTYGHIPQGMSIDHINGLRGDNRLSNLRLATKTQNGRNVGTRVHNTTGFKGVVRNGNGFTAQVSVGGLSKYVGWFKSPVEAACAYDAAATKHFGEFARTNAMMGLLPNTSANA